MTPLIEFKNVSLNYKRFNAPFKKNEYFNALSKVSFEIYIGETLGVVGKNGSGKSTLLELLSGVIQPTSGTIVNRAEHVSLLSLQGGLNQNLTGYDNTILVGLLLGMSRKQIKENIKYIKDYSGLEEFYHQPIRTYSSGMKSRLGFSISMFSNPDLMLIDETLSVGDKEFRDKAERSMIKKIKSNRTVVFVSHSLDQVVRLCDRVLVIDKGKIKYSGNPRDAILFYKNM